MATRFEIRVAGTVPASVLDAMWLRFGDVAVTAQAPLTVLTGSFLDQPQLRALLSLIWDSGGSVVYLAVTASSSLPPVSP